MKRARSGMLATIVVSLALGSSAIAKEGVQATVHTAIPSDAAPGTEFEVHWTLASEDDGRPFNATSVFIRLIGADGESSEAFAAHGAHPSGEYAATLAIPPGGVSSIEIGVAGTMTYPDGRQERSDWLMELANDPIL